MRNDTNNLKMNDKTDLSVINNISATVKEKDERIWANEAHIEAVKREIEKLDEEIKHFEFRTQELDEDNEQIGKQLRLMEHTTTVQQNSLKLTSDSLILLNDWDILRKEKTEREKEKYANALADCQSKFDEHKARYESTNTLFKQLHERSVEEKKIKINILDLKQKFADHCRIKNQYKEMTKMLFYKDVIRFSSSCLLHYKTKETFLKLKRAEALEKDLVRKSLELQKEVKERRNRAMRRVTVASSVPKIHFLPNGNFSGISERQFSLNTEKEDEHVEANEQQKTNSSIPALTLPKIDFQTPSFSQDYSQGQITTVRLSQDEHHNSNFSQDRATRRVRFSQENSKVRILDDVQIPPEKNKSITVKQALIADRILKVAKKIADKKCLKRKLSVSSSQSCSQNMESQNEKAKDINILSQRSTSSVLLTNIVNNKLESDLLSQRSNASENLQNNNVNNVTSCKEKSQISSQQSERIHNNHSQRSEIDSANKSSLIFYQDNQNKTEPGHFPGRTEVQSANQSSQLQFVTPPFQFVQKIHSDVNQNNGRQTDHPQQTSATNLREDIPVQPMAAFEESNTFSQKINDNNIGTKASGQLSRFFNERNAAETFSKFNKNEDEGGSLRMQNQEGNNTQNLPNVNFKTQDELNMMDSYTEVASPGDQFNFSYNEGINIQSQVVSPGGQFNFSYNGDQPTQNLNITYDPPVLPGTQENELLFQQPLGGFGIQRQDSDTGPKQFSFRNQKFSLF